MMNNKMVNSRTTKPLVRDVILVGNMTGDIPQPRLDQISADFNTYRQAGLKVIPRLCYHWGMVEPAPGPGETKTLQISKPLPAGIHAGEFDLFLNLPDPYPSLHDRPEYSIRLANKDVWNETTGYNSLVFTTTVK